MAIGLALSLRTIDKIQTEATRAHLQHADHSMLNPGMELWERLAILGEEFGEVCRAVTYDNGSRDKLEGELIQVAAMAASWIEAMNSR